MDQKASRELTGSAGAVLQEEEEKNVHRRQRPSSPTRSRATLLIATGRGKVCAGTFFRHHLPWGVVVVDPNVREDGAGYNTMRRSVVRLFPLGGRLPPARCRYP